MSASLRVRKRKIVLAVLRHGQKKRGALYVENSRGVTRKGALIF